MINRRTIEIKVSEIVVDKLRCQNNEMATVVAIEAVIIKIKENGSLDGIGHPLGSIEYEGFGIDRGSKDRFFCYQSIIYRRKLVVGIVDVIVDGRLY